MCSLNKSHAHIHYNIIPAECKLYFVHSAYFFARKGTDGEVKSGEWGVESGEMPDVALVEVDWG